MMTPNVQTITESAVKLRLDPTNWPADLKPNATLEVLLINKAFKDQAPAAKAAPGKEGKEQAKEPATEQPKAPKAQPKEPKEKEQSGDKEPANNTNNKEQPKTGDAPAKP